MFWLTIAIFAYFLNAVAMLADKFLLTKKVDNPAVYTFYVSLLSLAAVVLWPFGYVQPDVFSLGVALAGGLSFTAAMFYLFKSLSQADASQIGPLIGGISPIFVLIFAIWLLGDRLTGRELVGAAFLILSTIVMALAANRVLKLNLRPVLVAAALFAFSYVLAKYLYSNLNFITGFVLIRLGTALGAVFLLFNHANYRAIINIFQDHSRQKTGVFIFGQSAGALSAILVNYAISLANVTIVNALQGTQYVFLLLLTLLLSYVAPQILSEEVRGRALIFKIIAIILISAGLALLIW